MTKNRLLIVVALIVAALGAGCSGPTAEAPRDDKVFAGEEISIYGSPYMNSASATAIPANSLMWHEALNTLSFMPLASADPFDGVIITDWFTPPESINERFKISVYILSREIRCDGLSVALVHQQRDASGQWTERDVSTDTAGMVENIILPQCAKPPYQFWCPTCPWYAWKVSSRSGLGL